MWHELRQRLGDDAFWEMVRAWPARDPETNADRDDYPLVDEETGETPFFDAWLLGADHAPEPRLIADAPVSRRVAVDSRPRVTSRHTRNFYFINFLRQARLSAG